MAQNKVVAHYQDGRIVKGYTVDFLPTKPSFHLALADAPQPIKPVEVLLAQLKAVFFVKNLDGGPQPHVHRQDFEPGKPALGRKVRVVFKDGENLVGTTQGYDANRPGFFVFPADTGSNNERIFVVKGATKQVSFV